MSVISPWNQLVPTKANVSCVGTNTSFVFHNVTGLSVRSIVFTGCGAGNYDSTVQSYDVNLDYLTLEYGKGCGVCAHNVYGNITILNSVFTHMQGPGFDLYNQHHFKGGGIADVIMITIANSQFD